MKTVLMKKWSTIPLLRRPIARGVADAARACERGVSGDAPTPLPAARAADAPAGRACRRRRRQDACSWPTAAAAASRSSTPTSRKVVAEYDVGRGLADLAILPGGRHLLAVDQAANELLLLDYRDRSIRVVDRIKVSPDPVRLVVSADGSSCVVASLWSRRLTFVGLASRAPADDHPALSIAGSLDLPFCPRELAVVADGSKLVVADAFGGRLAVVDIRRRAIDSVRSLPAHNIRGLAFAPDGQTLVIAHQVLNRLAQTSFDDVHWGALDPQPSAGLADRRPVECRSRRRAARRQPAIRPGRRRLCGGRPGRSSPSTPAAT